MKSLTIHALAVVLLAFLSTFSFGQCISTFPYTQDFEGLTVLQDTSSCQTSIPGDTVDGWTQPTTDNGEWRADTAGNPVVGTGPGATRGTSGEGVGTDYDPGTTSGKYYYVDAARDTNVDPKCYLVDVSLLSPCFDFSGADRFQLKFAYYMYGYGVGILHIDVLDSNVWYNDVYIIRGEKGAKWNIANVDLTIFNKSNTQIRFRYTIGHSLRSQCAIDAVTVQRFIPAEYDAEIVDVTFAPLDYLLVPIKHAKDIRVDVILKNNGTKTVSGTTVNGTTNWDGSSKFGSIGSGESIIDTFSVRIDHDGLKGRNVRFSVGINETDTVSRNNSFTLRTNLSDSVYARDDSLWTASLGYTTGSGFVGSMYELLEDDTLTSVSFFLDKPPSDSTRAYLYEYNAAPGQLIGTSKFIQYNSDAAWYTCDFECPQILTKGKYFVAIEQVTSGNRIEIACAGDRNFVENTQYFGTGTTWTEFKSADLIYTQLIRMNFGSLDTKGPILSILNLKDTICDGDVLSLKATGLGVQGFEWSPAAAFSNSSSQFTAFTTDTTVTIQLKAWSQCRIPSILEKTVVVKKKPSGIPSPDTTICLGDKVHLRMSTNNPYTWANGPSDKDYLPTPIGDRIYKVSIDSSNGCTRTYSININTSTPDLKVIPDTVTCEGEGIVLYATGGTSYEWDNGTKSDKNPVVPTSNTMYYVTATSSLGCERTDSVYVMTDPAPLTQVSNDTAVCFGQFITLRVQGGVSNEWVNGPKTEVWNFRPLSTKDYVALSNGQNGCVKRDTVHIIVAGIPNVDLRNDTVICEGESIDLEAITTDDVAFQWNSGDTSRMITVSPEKQSKYKVTVMNSVGCNASDSVTVFVDPLPVAGLQLTQTGEKITVINTSTNNTDNNWDFGDGRTSNEINVTHTYLDNGDYTIKLTVSNDCGTDDTSVTITVDNIGILDLKNTLGVLVRPNPTGEGYFTVSFEGDQYGEVSLSLVDMTGHELVLHTDRKESRYFETKVNVKGLSAGVYMLRVVAGEGSAVLPVAVY